MTSLNREEPDPFDEFETGGEIAAFIYRKLGEDGLRQLLEHDGTTYITRSSRDSLLDVAAELSAAGLRKAARIATEIAATKPPMTDLEAFCPYMVPPYVNKPGNEHNVTCWLRSQRHLQRKRELKRKQIGKIGNGRSVP